MDPAPLERDKDETKSETKPETKPEIKSAIDPIELQICLEKEKQKCLKGLQSYYQKYGCSQIDILRSYLTQLLEKDPSEVEHIQKQIDLLDDYS